MGIASAVCMPDGAPISKVEATKALGAQVCLVKGSYDDAYEKACQLQKESGATFIHPFDDEAVICPIAGKKTVCIFSGGNIDVTILSRVITRGLITTGRQAVLQIALQDKPGQLQEVSEIIATYGANVISVYHEHADPNMAISSCFLKVTMETRDFEQIQQIRQELERRGFRLITGHL